VTTDDDGRMVISISLFVVQNRATRSLMFVGSRCVGSVVFASTPEFELFLLLVKQAISSSEIEDSVPYRNLPKL
jgi:hypothetical protein